MKRMAWMSIALTVSVLLVGAALFLGGCEDEVAAEVLGGGQVAATQAPEPAAGTTVIEMPADSSSSVAGATNTEALGKGGTPAEVVAVPGVLEIDHLVENVDSYLGKSVAVRGMILAQCIRGCRFTLDDGTGVVNIELVDEALEEVLMKGSVGRTVEVRGIVDSTSPVRILVEGRNSWEYVD